MLLKLLNTVILLGCLQGFILCALLYFSPPKRLPERLLATLLLLLSLASLNIYLSESNMPPLVGVVLSLVPTIIFMPFGPLIYFYARSLIDPDFKLRREYRIHFLPVIIDVLPALAAGGLILSRVFIGMDREYQLQWDSIIGQYNSWSDLPRWISITAYLIVTKKYFLNVSASIRQRHQKHIAWLKIFLNTFLVFQAVWFVFLVPYIIPSSRFAVLYYVGYYPIYVPLAFLIYGLGIKGFLHSRLTAKTPSEGNSSQLTKEQADKLIAAITRAMEEEKLYRQTDIDLDRLIRYVGSDQRTVSHVLNRYFLKSFNNLINYYRVEEVKQRMAAPGNEHLTLSGIAFECGFNSQSTFQRAFRQVTSLSPKEYLERQTALKNR
ncbi:MAG TPA: helix-turn-helix domain-containing protein [Chryseosolibacter sp.]|nr:helix-turn-helix domain-containing protein [Chryseosolibacter sp.]